MTKNVLIERNYDGSNTTAVTLLQKARNLVAALEAKARIEARIKSNGNA